MKKTLFLLIVLSVLIVLISGCESRPQTKYNSTESNIEWCVMNSPNNFSLATCLSKAAVSWQDERICILIEKYFNNTLFTSGCIQDVSIAKGNVSICLLLSELYEKEICIEKFAIEKKDISSCSFIGDPSERVDCEVVVSGDPTSCAFLEKVWDRDSCYISFASQFKKPSACEFVKNIDSFYYCMAITKESESYCHKINDNDQKKGCLLIAATFI